MVWSGDRSGGRACGDLQEGEGERCPEPADLHKVDVYQVVFAGEVVRYLRLVGCVDFGGDAGGEEC